MAPNTRSSRAAAPSSLPPVDGSPSRQERTQTFIDKRRKSGRPKKIIAASVPPAMSSIPAVSSPSAASSPPEVSSHPATSPAPPGSSPPAVSSPAQDDDDDTPIAAGRPRGSPDTPTPTGANKHNPATRPMIHVKTQKNEPPAVRPKVRGMQLMTVDFSDDIRQL